MLRPVDLVPGTGDGPRDLLNSACKACSWVKEQHLSTLVGHKRFPEAVETMWSESKKQ